MFKTTSDVGGLHHKTLLYAHHGWGKTYQFRFFAEEYGKGLIISGEGGLASLSDVDIDFVEFKGWDRKHHPKLADDEYTFRDIIRLILSDDFKEKGYKWIGIDSLTEMSDQCMSDVEKNYEEITDMRKWQDYERQMIGALKTIRDLPLEVFVTCLAKEEKNDNGGVDFWPMVQQAKVSKKIPALFDHVFCGQKTTEEVGGSVMAKRLIITDEIRGWHGKTRDPHRSLDAVEGSGNVVELLKRIKAQKNHA